MESSSALVLMVGIQAIFGFIQILLALVAWLGKRALDRIEMEQRNLIHQVQITNGTVIKLETASADHNRLDDTRFADMERRIESEEKRR